ncbi:hypothetical protein [Iningainema tapete]|uniref:Uncharacterized protein n=1 Tax=Iningainema tapete BLCC-T55 TaxID=2748662 RepID=A0A8J6XL15_9CYAN|nr:hypothetical protein [Iningainema tapete]MBD2773569.1 hypothetical protein [Iningainema tapete BLCC-T55]
MPTMNDLEATRHKKAQVNPTYVTILTLNNYGLVYSPPKEPTQIGHEVLWAGMVRESTH